MPVKYRPLRFTAKIGAHPPQIRDDEVATAISPAEPVCDLICSLNDHYSDGTRASWANAISEIENIVAQARQSDDPLAIFAFAPIPLLIALGALLGDKNPSFVFERHRHIADVDPARAWCWEEEGPELTWAPFSPPRLHRGAKNIALLLSISGPVDHSAISEVLPQQHPQYEIRLEEPRTNVMRTKAHLASFVMRWRQILDQIRSDYGDAVHIHVFPAIPLSVAVECGRRMLQADPTLRIYNATGSSYRYALTVGPKGVMHEPEMAMMDKADILVLVALEEEFEQLYSLFPVPVPVTDDQHGGCYYIYEIADRQVVVRLVGGMGTGDAQLVADRAIERWKPKAAVWVGIAASIHKDVRLVDVVVPDQVDAYDANLKAVDDGDGKVEFKERGEVFRADHALVQVIQNLKFAHHQHFKKWEQECKNDLISELSAYSADIKASLAKKQLAIFKQIVHDQPVIKVGHIASGNVLGATEAFSERLQKRDSSILGLEMETAGLTRAAHKRVETVPVLALRGISDFGDQRKESLDRAGSGMFRRVAMRNATRLLLVLLEAKLLP